MLRPSYSDLIEVLNSEIEPGEAPVVQSRYSIVIAASKRARQLIDGAEPLVGGSYRKKSLSVSVEELYKGKVKILSEEELEAEEEAPVLEDAPETEETLMGSEEMLPETEEASLEATEEEAAGPVEEGEPES